jgi:hypothetical protein
MHLSDEQIQRALHGELDAPARDDVTRHVAECSACARALADARNEEAGIFGLLEHLDHEPPVVDASAVRAPSREWARRAAGFVVVAALAGAAYAIPGSPLPALVQRLVSSMTGGQGATPPAGGDASTPATPATSGIAVRAVGNLVIEFAATQRTGAIIVSFTDDTMVRVRVIGGASSFITDVERLDIVNHGSSAGYEIEIPRSVSRIEIRAAGHPLLLKDGERLTTSATADGQGRYRIPLVVPPGP